MTKDAELKTLDSFIENCPRDSYLGSLLRHLRPQFEADMRSDFETLPDLAALERERIEARQRVKELLAHQEKIRQEILGQRAAQAAIYEYLNEAKSKVFSIAASLETVVNNFHKDR